MGNISGPLRQRIARPNFWPLCVLDAYFMRFVRKQEERGNTIRVLKINQLCIKKISLILVDMAANENGIWMRRTYVYTFSILILLDHMLWWNILLFQLSTFTNLYVLSNCIIIPNLNFILSQVTTNGFILMVTCGRIKLSMGMLINFDNTYGDIDLGQYWLR